MTAQRRQGTLVLPLFLLFFTTLAAHPSQTCLDIIHTSDVNGDNILQPDEYAVLVAGLSKGQLGEHVVYVGLPFAARWNFVVLSCRLAPPWGTCLSTGDCCEGAPGGIDLSPGRARAGIERDEHLRMVCVRTEGALESVWEAGDDDDGNGKELTEEEVESVRTDGRSVVLGSVATGSRSRRGFLLAFSRAVAVGGTAKRWAHAVTHVVAHGIAHAKAHTAAHTITYITAHTVTHVIAHAGTYAVAYGLAVRRSDTHGELSA